MEKYSILMAVYHKDNPEYFEISIKSMLNQTVKSDDFVIVCDGPLTNELNQIIEVYQSENPEINVLRLDHNVGLGKALNIALESCKHDLIARMDSDDISHPNRFERQLKCFYEHPEYSIVGAAVNEYDVAYTKLISVKRPPETPEVILKYSKKRNPFNHPCVMFRKSHIMDAGNYQPFYLYEDYHLWVRVLLKGYQGYNFQEPLLDMRAGEEMLKRRGGLKYFKASRSFQVFLYKQKHIGLLMFTRNVVIRFIAQVLLPSKVRLYFYKKYLRKA